VDVDDAVALRLIGLNQYIFLDRLPVRFAGDGVVWLLVEVLLGHKIIERLGRLLFVESVFPDGFSQQCEVRSQGPFARGDQRSAVGRNGNGQQDRDDRQDDHQLE